jgi:chaperone BCS1
MLSLQNIPKTKTVLSMVAAAVLIPSIVNLCILYRRFSSQVTLVVEGYEQEQYNEELFVAAETFLGTKLASSIQRIKASKRERERERERLSLT